MAPPNKSTESDDDDDDVGALIYMKSQLTKVEAAAQLPQEQDRRKREQIKVRQPITEVQLERGSKFCQPR